MFVAQIQGCVEFVDGKGIIASIDDRCETEPNADSEE
jgi:hypothetical protein